MIRSDIHTDCASHLASFDVNHGDCIADSEGNIGGFAICGNSDAGNLWVFQALPATGEPSGDIGCFVILKGRVDNPRRFQRWASVDCDIDNTYFPTRLRGEDTLAIRHPGDTKRTNGHINFPEGFTSCTEDGNSALAEGRKALAIRGYGDIFWSASRNRDDLTDRRHVLVRWSASKAG